MATETTNTLLTSSEMLNTLEYVQKIAQMVHHNHYIENVNHKDVFPHAGDADSHFNTTEFLAELRKILKKTLPTHGDGDKENNRISDRFISRFQQRFCKSKHWRRESGMDIKTTFCKFFTKNKYGSPVCTIHWMYQILLEIQNKEESEKLYKDANTPTWSVHAIHTSLEKKRMEEALDYLEKYITIMEQVGTSNDSK